MFRLKVVIGWHNKSITTASAHLGTNGFNVVDSSYNFSFSNGITYLVLSTVTNYTTENKNNRYYRLFIAKGAGIVGFDEYPSNKRWVV